jgi:hypothetical protein
MRSYLLVAWNLFDPIYYNLTRLTYIHNEVPEENVLRVRLTRYKGKDVILSDGTPINKNDLLVKIHLHNVRLLNDMQHIKSDIKRGRFIYQSIRKSLPILVSYIQKHDKADEIKGIIGITMLDKGASRLGFEMVPISNPLYKWYKWTSLLPINLLSTTSPSFKNVLKQSGPSYLFMSKARLSSMYKV